MSAEYELLAVGGCIGAASATLFWWLLEKLRDGGDHNDYGGAT